MYQVKTTTNQLRQDDQTRYNRVNLSKGVRIKHSNYQKKAFQKL